MRKLHISSMSIIRDERHTNVYPSSIDVNDNNRDHGWEESQLTFDDGHDDDVRSSGGIIQNDYHCDDYDGHIEYRLTHDDGRITTDDHPNCDYEHTPNVKIIVREECDRSEGRGDDEDGGSHYSRSGAEEEERSLYEQHYDIHGDEDPITNHRWACDGIKFNRIQRPQSMPFHNDDDDGEEHSYIITEHGVPMNEILVREVSNDSFEFENPRDEENYRHSLDDDDRNNYDIFSQHDELEYQHDGIFNVQSYDDDNCSLDSDQETDFHSTANSILPTPVFRTSESLDVIHRIELVMLNIVKSLDKFECVLRGYVNPESQENEEDDESDDNVGEGEVEAFFGVAAAGGDPTFHRNFDHKSQSRSFVSICLVMSFIHQLLMANRTTTTREVYYVFVTHFRNQRECDDVILDVAKVLGVSRRSLGLSASPKGWFCGCVEISRRGTLPSGQNVSGTIDGTALLSVQGLPITREWTERDIHGRTEDGVEIKLTSKNARAILVIEKEGVYNRLSEERIFDRFPCILVTGKGFPDLATRALVSALHRELDIPVIGLCDCNPFGLSVLALYHYAGERMGIDGRNRYTVPMRWLGLRPSEVAELKDELPDTVFQKLSELDHKRIASLLDSGNPFLTEEDEEEVRIMGDSGYKVELEALYWLGSDYMGNWVVEMLKDECDRIDADS
jgi:meiotic recombination protein SPO11